jgi:hypothetical protein
MEPQHDDSNRLGAHPSSASPQAERPRAAHTEAAVHLEKNRGSFDRLPPLPRPGRAAERIAAAVNSTLTRAQGKMVYALDVEYCPSLAGVQTVKTNGKALPLPKRPPSPLEMANGATGPSWGGDEFDSLDSFAIGLAVALPLSPSMWLDKKPEEPNQADAQTGCYQEAHWHKQPYCCQERQVNLSIQQLDREVALHHHRILYEILAALGIESSMHHIMREFGIERVFQLALVTKEDLINSSLKAVPKNILLGLLHGMVIDRNGHSVQGEVSWQGDGHQKLCARLTSAQERRSQRPHLNTALGQAIAWAEMELMDFPD